MKLYHLLKYFILLSIFLSVSAFAVEKPRIAIKPPVYSEKISSQAKKRLDGQLLLTELENAVQKTRKFELLTRQSVVMSALREEQKFAGSDLAKGNAAHSGQLENANYLVIPIIQNFSFYRSSKPVPNIDGKYVVKDHGVLAMQAQVVDTTTGGVKGTFNVKSSYVSKKRISSHKGGIPSTEILHRMIKKASAQFADQLVDTILPMKVLKVSGHRVWINRGQDGGIHKGTVLNVYHAGEALIDPDTGENLGAAEEYAGKVRIERVNPKFSIGRIQKGESIKPGDILRKPN